MTDSSNTAAVLLHDQILKMEGKRTTFAKSPYFNTSTGPQNITSMDFKLSIGYQTERLASINLFAKQLVIWLNG